MRENLAEDPLLKKTVQELTKPQTRSVEVQKRIGSAQEHGFVVGAKVTRKHNDEVGEVIGYNEKVSGFYPGHDFPIRVTFPSGTFEYSEDSLELVEKTS